MYINQENINDGNRIIAEFLGYEYVPSNSSEHEHPTIGNITINHGYWRRKVRNIADLGQASVDGFPLVLHKPKLAFETSYNDILKIMMKIGRLKKYNAEFRITTTYCEITAVVEPDIDEFQISIQFRNNNNYVQLMTMWSCIVAFCRYYKNHQ